MKKNNNFRRKNALTDKMFVIDEANINHSDNVSGECFFRLHRKFS